MSQMPVPVKQSRRIILRADWKAIRKQLVLQWRRLSPREVEEAGPNPAQLAKLIGREYRLSPPVVEYYLQQVDEAAQSLNA